MKGIPESEFGLRDYLVIFLTVMTAIILFNVIPEQKWITEDEVGLLVSQLVITFILSAIAWFAFTKWLIPSDAELIDLDVKRQINRGMDDIAEDAETIKEAGKEIGMGYKNQVNELGETLARIHRDLKNPDLATLAQIEGKIFRFVALLNGFLPYTLKPSHPKYKRTTQSAFESARLKFETTLEETATAFKNLEEGLNAGGLSEIEVLSNTLHDLYAIDGLLTTDERKKQISETKRRVL